jgi:hypothetical protein
LLFRLILMLLLFVGSHQAKSFEKGLLD